MQMLCIRDIDVFYADPNRGDVQLRQLNHEPQFAKDGEGREIAMTEEMVTETVQGRRFTNRHGDVVCIGLSEKVGRILGLEYEAWEEMEAEIAGKRAELHRSASKLIKATEELCDWHRRVTAVGRARWWTRLKWLFTGVKYPDILVAP